MAETLIASVAGALAIGLGIESANRNEKGWAIALGVGGLIAIGGALFRAFSS